MEDIWYLVIITSLIIIVMVASLFTIQKFLEEKACSSPNNAWCFDDWTCSCGGNPRQTLPCAMAAARACDIDSAGNALPPSTAFSKLIAKYPSLNPELCLAHPKPTKEDCASILSGTPFLVCGNN